MRTLGGFTFPCDAPVFVRVDFNVPMDEVGTITDDLRIRASLPTIESLLGRGAPLILISHLGRPVKNEQQGFSLKPCAERLSEYIGVNVPLVDFLDLDTKLYGELTRHLDKSGIVLFENIRFFAEETSKAQADRRILAEQLAPFAGAYVNDAFGASHRRHASVYELAQAFSNKAAGFLIESEMQAFSHLASEAKRPYTVILGGAKLSDKLRLIENILPTVDRLLLCGGMAFTFLAAQGCETGKSLLEESFISEANKIIDFAKQNNVELILPVDVIEARSLTSPLGVVSKAESISYMGLDIGPETQSIFRNVIQDSKTVFWNGPAGLFENPSFSNGTRALLDALSSSSAFTFIGGGDTAAAVSLLGFDYGDFSHVSTGGGACLELLEGKILPALEVL
ncbi:MAG: phosphoglycerate kinase [Tropheryma whipplei]|uniref:Phosphoglycerate kinase n=1 Tax=Tropheryma whipplei (strain TW08/27) TaxID=218496 RepID=PGK_TROW8|nr:phosphoglycerate kinase [Tropheryma whipplei]Q83HP8.1 RecName: Full=Phosphoglycerate kinase [Tropheryma whipplei TW08/27]MCO8190207.1 phosphoglycerate kinase [Tropheryma whipplei]CAD67138.1 phosphoglycerate kinase [Tropheryma whipplei TW08/27]